MDHPTRLLQRRRDAGDPQAGEALLRSRIRAGQVRVQRIALLALCGHELARELTGITLRVPPLPHREWKRACRGAGKVATLSALAAGFRAATSPARGQAPRPLLAGVLDCVEAWCLLRRREEQEALVAKHREELEEACHRCHPQPSCEGHVRLAGILLDRRRAFASGATSAMHELLELTRGEEQVALAPMREVLVERTLMP